MLATTAAAASAWALPPGELRATLSSFVWSTGERYAERPGPPTDTYSIGDRIAFDFGGESETLGLHTSVALGLTRGVEVGLAIPWARAEFRNSAERLNARGLGDLRAWAAKGERVGPLACSVTFAVKAPTGAFESAAWTLPLGDGQWDWDLSLAAGRSFAALWIETSAGHRLRGSRGNGALQHASEWLYSLRGGWTGAGRWGLGLGLDGFEGRAGADPWVRGITDRALTSGLAEIRMRPTMGAWGIGLRMRHTLRGRNHPAGIEWALGIDTQLSVGLPALLQRRGARP